MCNVLALEPYVIKWIMCTVKCGCGSSWILLGSKD